ncbi:MAG: YkgJ family cysteine cluster protein [archaeon]
MYFKNHCRVCPDNVHCCKFKGGKGFAFVGAKDADRIKKYTKKELYEFIDYSKLPESLIKHMKDEDPCLEGALRYSQLKNKRLAVLKTQRNGDCIFLKNGKCCIYKVRPNICKIFPFWAMRLLDGRIKVIEHDERPRCSIVSSGYYLTKQKEKEIKRIFRIIEKESLIDSKFIDAADNKQPL